ncbi:ABC-type transporter, periplasmic component [Desulfovibrio sp. TomC]|nr:ABC-type transporter, periplasmic component [Desulfovibrio sp. TomC]
MQVAVAALLLAVGGIVSAGTTPDAVRLGMTAGFSGPTRAMAVEVYRGAVACFDQHNRQGGPGDRPVELRVADDGYEPGPAIENTVRFLTRDKVLALFSQLGTPTVSRVLPVLRAYADQGARLFFPVSGLEAARMPPYVRYTYNLRASYRQEIESLVAYFTSQGLTRIAICHQADAFGRSGWDGARRALARRGLSLCGEATFVRTAATAEDMLPQARVLAACTPQAILLVGAGPACTAFIRDVRRAGLTATVGVVSFAGGDILLRALADEGVAQGLDLERNLVLSQVTPDWRDDSLPAAREYRQALVDLGDRLPPPGGWGEQTTREGSSVGFEGYLNARLLLAVLGAMPDPGDRTGLDQAAAAIGQVDLGIGRPVSLANQAHQALDVVYLSTAEGTRLMPLRITLATVED